MFRMQQSNQYPIRLKFTVFNSILTHFVSFITGDFPKRKIHQRTRPLRFNPVSRNYPKLKIEFVKTKRPPRTLPLPDGFHAVAFGVIGPLPQESVRPGFLASRKGESISRESLK